MEDLSGLHYPLALARLHAVLRPATYFEVGTLHGTTLALASCASVAVDPRFRITPENAEALVGSKPSLQLFQETSDRFFARRDLTALLGGPVELAFLDGMHLCEVLLRDFRNTERHCRPNSVIALHDCLPVEPGIAARRHDPAAIEAPHRKGWWTGDAWRVALWLKRRRPGLRLLTLDAQSTGLVLATGLDPDGGGPYDAAFCVEEMLSWSLEEITVAGLLAELEVQPAAGLLHEETISRHFWL